MLTAVFICADLYYSFLCSFSWFLREKKEKEPKEKRTFGGNSLPFPVLSLPKTTADFFQNFVKRNLKIVTFVLSFRWKN